MLGTRWLAAVGAAVLLPAVAVAVVGASAPAAGADGDCNDLLTSGGYDRCEAERTKKLEEERDACLDSGRAWNGTHCRDNAEATSYVTPTPTPKKKGPCGHINEASARLACENKYAKKPKVTSTPQSTKRPKSRPTSTPRPTSKATDGPTPQPAPKATPKSTPKPTEKPAFTGDPWGN